MFAARLPDMTNNPRATAHYEARRGSRTVPHVPLSALRVALGLTVETVIERIAEETAGKTRLSRGTISAIEKGRRSASVWMLAAMAMAIAYSVKSHQPAPTPGTCSISVTGSHRLRALATLTT